MFEQRVLWTVASVLLLLTVVMAAGSYIGIEIWCVVNSCGG